MLKKDGMLLHIRPFFLICVIKHTFFLRLTKVGVQRYSFFYARTLRMEQNQSFFTISLLSPVVCCDNIVKRIRVSFFWLHE